MRRLKEKSRDVRRLEEVKRRVQKTGVEVNRGVLKKGKSRGQKRT